MVKIPVLFFRPITQNHREYYKCSNNYLLSLSLSLLFWMKCAFTFREGFIKGNFFLDMIASVSQSVCQCVHEHAWSDVYAKEDWEKSLSIHWINTSSLFSASFLVFNICIHQFSMKQLKAWWLQTSNIFIFCCMDFIFLSRSSSSFLFFF